MKKILLLGSIACSTFFCYSSTDDLIVTREHRGIFGYRHVVEFEGEGHHTLTCSDPGRTRCKTNGITVIDNTLSLTDTEFDAIDTNVETQIKDGKEAGKFVFENKALILFSYDVDSDRIVYTIYSMTEARSLNLIQ